ncbi:hypothetical protein KAX02_13775 [candidate division WOR-3 bacterium]|nr:hypothetical protein [candidate division WOR-3 bacterium]
MKRIAEQANNLVEELQKIADSLADYNPGLCKDKTLDVIQYDLACLGREITWFYAEIGKKIKE